MLKMTTMPTAIAAAAIEQAHSLFPLDSLITRIDQELQLDFHHLPTSQKLAQDAFYL